VRGAVERALSGLEGTEERARRALELVCETCAARGGHFYLTSDDGLVLAASQGSPPPADLQRLAREHLAREVAKSEVLTIVESGIGSSVTLDSAAPTRAEAASYELLLVAGLSSEGGHVAGVMALAFGDDHVREGQQAQLLAAIASEFRDESA
jgi:hypothetical protein